MIERIKYPNFEKINQLVHDEIDINFYKYDNTWQKKPYNGANYNDKKWWEKRLLNEMLELKKANKNTDRKNELVDIIVIASFMLENIPMKKFTLTVVGGGDNIV